jgi:hypothetical protein
MTQAGKTHPQKKRVAKDLVVVELVGIIPMEAWGIPDRIFAGLAIPADEGS